MEARGGGKICELKIEGFGDLGLRAEDKAPAGMDSRLGS